ncbi:hypothetical protein [Acetobacter malorum]|uniref:hypothetical protein n=1 Tax=Acetobacter malorum TaxID=178901 RepID=UPI0012E90A69|nr:hypothetical protein [Acetobacter malorum]
MRSFYGAREEVRLVMVRSAGQQAYGLAGVGQTALGAGACQAKMGGAGLSEVELG